ncbi:hypothetical protein SKAU_G00175920 [Synaphobranchus kaupii]|uniref:Uncharacterized protein n=1 Tax=Synaphobranchus kaupii TaxID=118154 RepID=A0A9Q1J1B4_SYNKA|nr:hypothetical protein SKAU_G00175920 [Synaphobranchus kaupii]
MRMHRGRRMAGQRVAPLPRPAHAAEQRSAVITVAGGAERLCARASWLVCVGTRTGAGAVGSPSPRQDPPRKDGRPAGRAAALAGWQAGGSPPVPAPSGLISVCATLRMAAQPAVPAPWDYS